MQAVLNNTSYTLQDHDITVGEDIRYVLKVRDLPLQDKPREKMLATGPRDLSLAELVAIVLGHGTKKEEVMSMANRILKEYGEHTIVNEADPQRISDTLDIPLAKACQLVACFELGRRFFDTKSGQPVYIRTASQAYEHVRDMAHLQKEQLRGLYLNSRHQVIYEEVISVGSLTANIVHPREVFRPAIEHGAIAVIVAHNHPSGNIEPTEADMEVTTQLRATGTVLGIELLDHIIVAEDHYMSIMAQRPKGEQEV